jgi:hypothetical protein
MPDVVESEVSLPRIVARVRDQEGLRQALKRRFGDLGLTYAQINQRAGLSANSVAKIFARTSPRQISGSALDGLLRAGGRSS